jgi:hypothetical protein
MTIHLNVSSNTSCEELNKWTPVQSNLLYSNVPQRIKFSIRSWAKFKDETPLNFASRAAKYIRRNDNLTEWQEPRYILHGAGNDNSSSLDSWWVYQSSGNSWIRLHLKTQPPKRHSYTMTTLCYTKVIFFGGHNNNTGQLFNDTWLFDGVTETWEELNVGIEGAWYVEGRVRHTAVAVSQPISNCSCRESLLVYGGSDSIGQRMWEMRCNVDETGKEKYNWISKMNKKYTDSIIPPNGIFHCAVAVSDSMYVWGGAVYSALFLFDGIWEYSLKSGLWNHHGNVKSGVSESCITRFCLSVRFQSFSDKTRQLLVVNDHCTYILNFNGTLMFINQFIEELDSSTYTNMGPDSHGELDFANVLDYYIKYKPLQSGPEVYAFIPDISGFMTFMSLSPPESQPSYYHIDRIPSPVFGTDSLLYVETDLLSNFWSQYAQLDNRISLWHFDFRDGVWFQICPLFSPGVSDRQIHRSGQAYATARNRSLLFRYSPFDSLAPQIVKEHMDNVANYIWVFHTEIRMWTLCLEISGQHKLPRPRKYTTLTEIANGSLLMFGGLTMEGEVLNDLWRLDVCDQNEYRPLRRDCVRWTLINGNPSDFIRPIPRYQPVSFFYNDSLFVMGGIGDKANASNASDGLQLYNYNTLDVGADINILLSDMWQLPIGNSQWKKRKLNGYMPVSKYPIFWKLAQTEAKVILVAGSYDVYEKCAYKDFQDMVKCLSNWTRENPFVSTLVLDLMSLSLSKLADAPPGIPLGIQFIGGRLIVSSLYNADIGLSSLTPACPPGHFSEKWDAKSCQRCAKDSYSALGSSVCTKCPEGLTTVDEQQKSSSDCVCSTDYCVHGKCIVAAVKDNERSAVCQCPVGFSGSKCQYPTYYLIGASVVGVIILVFFLTVFIKKMLRHRKEKRTVEEELTSVLRVWDIPRDEVTLHERIDGETPGSYGEVYRATYRDGTVAVKYLNEIMLSDPQIKKSFERELEVMRGIRHRNVIMFVGAGHVEIEENGEKVLHPFLVVEFMSRGTLKKVLDAEEISLSYRDKVSFALDAARGLQYLHSLSPPRIHRDMKSANLLVSHSWVVKVSDFGSARVVREEGERQPTNRQRYLAENATTPLLQSDLLLTRDTGSLLWRAPEIFAMQNYGTSADVYSYGIVLWEILSREVPYRDHCFRWIKDISMAVQGGTRPTLPPNAPTLYVQLIKDCWQTNPDTRPTFTNIVDRLVLMADVLHDSQISPIAEA